MRTENRVKDTTYELETPYTLREFMASAFRDGKWLLVAFLGPILLAVVLASSMAPTYETKSTLMVRLGREHIYQPEVGEANAPPIAINREETLRSELNILTSRDLQEKVINEIGVHRFAPKLAPTAAKSGKRWQDLALLQMDEALSAELLKDTNVIEVTFKHRDPVVAAEVVNRLVGHYIQKRQTIMSEHRAPFMEGEVNTYRQRLADAEAQISAFKRENNIVSYERQRELLLNELSGLEIRIKEVNAKIAEVKGRLEVIGASGAPTGNTALENESYRLPAVREMMATESVKLRAEQRSAIATRDTLAQQRKRVKEQLVQFAEQESKLEQLVRDKGIIEGRYQSNSKRLEDARILEDLDKRAKTSVSVIQQAVPPVKRKSTRMIILALGLVVSVVSVAATAFLRDLMRGGFLLPDQLQRSLGLPVLASFPRVSKK